MNKIHGNTGKKKMDIDQIKQELSKRHSDETNDSISETVKLFNRLYDKVESIQTNK